MAWYKCVVDNSYDGVVGYRKGQNYDLPSDPGALFSLISAPSAVLDDDNEHHAQTDLNGVLHVYDVTQFEQDVSFEEDVFFDNITGEAGIQKHVAWNSGTGLIDIVLPGITKTDDTEFTVHAGSGNFLGMTDASDPTLAHVRWVETTGITDTYATTNLRTWITVDAAGDIVQFADEVTALERRTHIVLGVLTHTDGATITQTNLVPVTSYDIVGKVTDLCDAVKFVNLSGNVYSGASSSVNSLAVTAGMTFACDRNYTNSQISPNVNEQSADTDISSFFTGYHDGAGGGTVGAASVVDATKYDDLSGTLATLDTGFWVTHRLFRSSTSGSTLLVYGQATHKGRTEALNQIGTENYTIPPGAEELILRGYLTIKSGAAGLQDTATSVFTPCEKFGEVPTNRPSNGFDIGIPIFKSESFTSRGVSAGTFYMFGNYSAPTSDVTLTQASLTQTYGAANAAYGMRPFAVFAGDGTVDTGVVGLRVNGTTITDGGVRTATDTQVISTDITAPALDAYLEPAKKFLGQVEYELYVVSGSPTAYSVSFNYGFAKYEDFGNRDFMLTDVEVTGLAGFTDNAAQIVVLKHTETGWTYSAAGFEPGDGEITSMNTIYSTEDELVNGEPFFFKLDSSGLNVPILGAGSEGVVIKIVAGGNNTYQILNAHLGVQI